MKAIEVFQRVMTDGVQLVRPRKDALGEYDIKPFFTGNKRGWTAVDSFTAGAVTAVHKALNETNRTKFEALPLMKMVNVSWKLVK